MIVVESRYEISPRPGIAGTVGRQPVLMKTQSARTSDAAPSGGVASSIRGPTKRPRAASNVRFGVSRMRRSLPLRKLSTMSRLRRRTVRMSTETGPVRTP
jgi:hypothetical protein